jgi:hypothetical protein
LLWQLQLEAGCKMDLHGISGFGGGLQLQLNAVMANFFVLYLRLWRFSALQLLGVRFGRQFEFELFSSLPFGYGLWSLNSTALSWKRRVFLR